MQTVSRVLSHGRTELAKVIVGGSAHSDEPNEYQRLAIRLRIAGLLGRRERSESGRREPA